MMRWLCRLGRHKWTVVRSEYRTSKAGILFGFMDVEQESCGCGAERTVLQVSTLFGRIIRRPLQRWPEGILEGWLPPAELQQWRVDEGERQIAEALEKLHTCGAEMSRVVWTYDMFTATGQPKERIQARCRRCGVSVAHYYTHY